MSIKDNKKAKKQEYINIEGARVNNLKNISIKIPRDKLVVISGLSGSGKSSLAFETLFAEGQRRFAESLSAFARQFLGRMTKPAVDKIEGIPPAIAIEQKVNTRNPRSTVGTNTEIYDYLRLIYAKIGRTYSPISGAEVKCENVADVISYITLTYLPDTVIYIIAPFNWIEEKQNRVELLLNLKQQGYGRLYCLESCEIIRIDNVLKNIAEYNDKSLYLLIDRFLDTEDTSRMQDSIETAFGAGKGKMNVVIENKIKEFSNIFETDGIKFEKLNELNFSYNNPIGACPVCGGYGSIVGIDESLVIPNQSLSVYEGAIACWRGETMGNYLKQLILNANKFSFPIHKPYAELTKEQKKLLWTGNEYFTGINGFFDMVESNKYKIQFKYMLARYSGKTTCTECEGSRLRKDSNYVKIGGKNIAELLSMPISDLLKFFKQLQLEDYENKVAERAIKEIIQRLGYINKVGLGYLSLSRAANSLSGGESQRINLVSSLGSSLVGSLYILDEPSIGLHPYDTDKLIEVIKGLRDLNNTVVIVEHDAKIIKASDQLIDIGPYAGVNGGETVFQGTIDKGSNPIGDYFLSPKGSLTLDYLRGVKKIIIPDKKRKWQHSIEICGAMEHNLKNINVKFPLGVITVVTGVSGSGKSSLVGEILYPAVGRYLQQFTTKPGAFKELKGDLDKISAIEFVDQNPIGRSSRSNPVTYLKIYDDIRKIFSEQTYAKINGYGNSHFSFNIDGGRCPNCLGDGFITIPMQFMADVKMVCEECGGKRFKPDILEVKYQGKNINDILNMSVEEAITFFSSQKENSAKKVAQRLKVLDDVGLAYVKLGQSSSTLSGGESQRIKLAQFLSSDNKVKIGKTNSILFIFDEPTTGLHFHDIEKLLRAFNALVDKGHSIVVVEHNTDIIKACDWVIDLGPGGGNDGGQICFCGSPADLAKEKGNKTADAIAESF